MKIKLQEYGIISIKMIDGMINELEGFKTGDLLKDLPTRSLIGTLEGLKQQLIPAEISDEEILNAAKESRLEDLITSIGSFELGARWYREQLTQNKNF
jgi:hypothetical protein